jgi:DNA-binding SARP family transcriptional activator
LREVADPEYARQTVNLLGVEASVLALDREWVRAASVADHAIALAEREAFPISDVWTLQITRQRIAIGGGDTRGARTALLAMAALHPPGMKRDFTEVLADVASAAEWLRSEGAIPEALTRGILERASALAWPGFATLIAPLAAELCAAGLRLGIAPEFARQVIRERHLPAPRPYEPHWPCPVRIHALGGFRIEVGGEAVSSGPRGQKKTLDLLKAIVAHGPPPVDAAIVLDALWPDADGAAARSAFDVTALRLRKLLGHDAALRIEGGRIGLDRDTVWVDAFAFAHGAIDDYPGPLFGSDTVQPWWAAARERLHQRFLKRTAERGHALERAGALDAALAAYEAALVQDPLAEEMYRGAIRCHLAAGRASDALRAYRRCRDQLAIVLGVAPSRATTSLVAALSAG